MTSYGHCLILRLSIVLHGQPSIRVRPGVHDFRRAAHIKISVQVVEEALAALGMVRFYITRMEGVSMKREYH